MLHHKIEKKSEFERVRVRSVKKTVRKRERERGKRAKNSLRHLTAKFHVLINMMRLLFHHNLVRNDQHSASHFSIDDIDDGTRKITVMSVEMKENLYEIYV